MESYCKGLIDQNFVNVGEGNFLAQELHVHRGKRLAGRQSPPLGQLRKEQTAHHHILHGVRSSVCDPVHLVAYSLDDTPHLGNSVSILIIRDLQKSLLESLGSHSDLCEKMN